MLPTQSSPYAALTSIWTQSNGENCYPRVRGELLIYEAIRRQTVPKYLSSDHDPLYRFHQWQANLRVLGVTKIKTVPHGPLSHPFVERLIGTIRRKCLDQLLFWTAADLEAKLLAFKTYYNGYRVHSAPQGRTPIEARGSKGVHFESYRWQKHCRGLYQIPTAA